MKKIMIFIEGTAFNTRLAALSFTPENYSPIGKAVEKINGWHEKYEVVLCTFRKHNLKIVRDALEFYGVRYSTLEYRRRKESYADVTSRIMPDILIEDDCASIGGEKEMCITNVAPEIRRRIKSIVVKEFEGIDKLPDDFDDTKAIP